MISLSQSLSISKNFAFQKDNPLASCKEKCQIQYRNTILEKAADENGYQLMKLYLEKKGLNTK